MRHSAQMPDRELPDDLTTRPVHRRRRRWVIAGGIVVVLVVAAVVVVVLWQRNTAHEVSIADARRRYERSAPSSQPMAPAVLRPAAGVYLYRGSGNEALTLPPKDHAQGPNMPATVTHRADGCWMLRIDYSSAHWQQWTFCPTDGGLVETGDQTFETWDFVFTTYDSATTLSCDPPSVLIRAGMKAGDTWNQRCRGTSSNTTGETVTAGPYTFVGDAVVNVAGTKVPAYHFRQVRRLSGVQQGEQTVELWLDRQTGLMLRNIRSQTVHTESPIGSSTYTENGEFRVTSLTPQP
jgi:hypothetical protein